MRQLNPIQALRKVLNRDQKLGLFDSPSSEFLETIHLRISYELDRFFSKRLRETNRMVSSQLKRNMQEYKRNLKKKHNIKSYRISDLNPLFQERYETQRQLILSMVKTQNDENMNKLRNRFVSWVSLKTVGDDKAKLAEMTKLPSNKHTKFLLRDQTNKMNQSFDKCVSDFYGGAIAYQWKVNNDNRVVGKPGGKNPTPTEKHGNHWKRRDKWYYNPDKKKELIKKGVNLSKFAGDYNSTSDGMPGMPIGCRCWSYYIYDVEDLPKGFLRENRI